MYVDPFVVGVGIACTIITLFGVLLMAGIVWHDYRLAKRAQEARRARMVESASAWSDVRTPFGK